MSKFSRKQIIILVIILIILGLAIWFGVKFATNGTISVTSSSDNTVVISRIGNNGNNAPPSAAYSSTNTGSISVTVPTGLYDVVVSNKTLSSSQIVSVTGGKTIKVSLSPKKLGVAEPVSDRPVNSVVSDASNLLYLDMQSHNLYSIDKNNTEHILDSTHNFISIKWADARYGVAQDANSNFFLITESGIKPILLPYAKDNSKRYYYSVTPRRNIYLTDSKTVYFGTVEHGFKSIYSSDSKISLYDSTDQNVLMSEAVKVSKRNDVVSLNSSTGKTARVTQDLYESAWSPDGSHVLLSSDESTSVYDQNLKVITSLPDHNVNAPVWLDNETLLYGISDKLWEFNLTTHVSHILTNVTQIGYVGHITPSLDGAYIYFVVQNTTTSSYQLERIGLNGQIVSKTAQGLSALLPATIPPCNLNYINFTAPTVLVRSAPQSNASCTATANTFLKSYSHTLDLATLKIQPTVTY